MPEHSKTASNTTNQDHPRTQKPPPEPADGGSSPLPGITQLLKKRDQVASIADGEAAAKGGHYVWVRPDAADLAALADLADAGKLTVPMEHALPLAEAAQAWRLSQAPHPRKGRPDCLTSPAVMGAGPGSTPVNRGPQ
ncbi:oxidoreductase [Streptomyces sp. 769]|nr:oxidoreductase [Streptomyces sp. 769]